MVKNLQCSAKPISELEVTAARSEIVAYYSRWKSMVKIKMYVKGGIINDKSVINSLRP